jgi:hypothetical protein
MTTELAPRVNALVSQKVENLLAEARKMPQVKVEEKHHFGPNLYVKEVLMPAGAVIVGKPHKCEHLCNMMTGRMVLVSEDGEKVEVVAPMTFVGKPGRKVAYILEDVIFQNIYSTDETDIEKLESMFVETKLLEGH